MKKKFSLIVYLLIMAMFILPMSGCDIGDDDKKSGGSSATASKLVVVTSKVFEESGDYKIIKGNGLVSGAAVENPMYYVAPYNASNPERTLNLEFADEISSNDGFIITDEDGLEVLFAYNPEGNGEDINKTGNVNRKGTQGKVQKYTTLDLSPAVASSTIDASAVTLSADLEKVITLNGTTASIEGASLSVNNYVWHISPDHAGEYWTDGENTKLLTKAEYLAAVTSNDGVYIAKDIRYVPDYLTFSSSNKMAKAADDSEQMYVAYYSTKAEGVDSENKYVIAALPSEMGVGGGAPAGGTTGPAAITNFDEIVKAMTHSPSDALNNPVLHITKTGVYRLKGTWNGQIWIDIPDGSDTKSKKDENAWVGLILDNGTVKCTVGPALVFNNVYECAGNDNIKLDSETAVSTGDAWKELGEKLLDDDGDTWAGAVVSIANGSTNTFTGTNVARINDVTEKDAANIGKYVKAQDKLYKLDGTFHSRMTMIIGLEEKATTGTLNINSDYEGLDSEMHLFLESGTVNITADDDGINVNEDNISIFAMSGDVLTIKSSGGDGIDSNGYVVVTGGKLNITAGTQQQNSAGEAGIDAEKGVYIYDDTAYTWTKVGGKDPIKPDDPKVPTDNKITFSDGSSITYYATKAVAPAEGDKTNEERIAAGIPETSETFKLVNKVNNFGGLTDAK